MAAWLEAVLVELVLVVVVVVDVPPVTEKLNLPVLPRWAASPS
jgi:hypothetical protein